MPVTYNDSVSWGHPDDWNMATSGQTQVDFVWGHTGNVGSPLGYPGGLASPYIAVPDLRGLTQSQASSALSALRLRASVPFGDFKDPVWSQSPTPGSMLVPGSVVNLSPSP